MFRFSPIHHYQDAVCQHSFSLPGKYKLQYCVMSHKMGKCVHSICIGSSAVTPALTPLEKKKKKITSAFFLSKLTNFSLGCYSTTNKSSSSEMLKDVYIRIFSDL